jgi:hypothetical protein
MMKPPRDPQLMDPADDPEEFIAASIYHCPSIFPTRTEVLDHTMLTNGNGYEWSEDGKIRSVFAHIDPAGDEDSIATLLRKADEEEAEERSLSYTLPPEASMAAYYRKRAAELSAIRADYLHRARTYGPIQATEQCNPDDGRERRARMITSHDLKWTLLGRAPEHVDPRWRAVIDETRQLFEPILIEQGELF